MARRRSSSARRSTASSSRSPSACNTSRALEDDDEDDDADFERDRVVGHGRLDGPLQRSRGHRRRQEPPDGLGRRHPALPPAVRRHHRHHRVPLEGRDKLPVTTTKRALDTSSNVWLESLVKMKEGMRVWISYTNQWKNHPRSDQQTPLGGRPADAAQQGDRGGRFAQRKSRRRESDDARSSSSTRRRTRFCPSPRTRRRRPDGSSSRVRSRRCGLVSKMLFDDANEKPGIVGDKCFESSSLAKAKKRGG